MSNNNSIVLHEEGVAGHYEDMLAARHRPSSISPTFDDAQNTQATTFYTSGTTGAA